MKAIRLAVAAGKGRDSTRARTSKGQLFLIPTIEIDKNTVAAYEASQEYADRYSLQ